MKKPTLVSVFNKYNKLYFGNKLKVSSVRFIKLKNPWHAQTAFFSDYPPLIEINSRLQYSGKLTRIVLLHEMAHVANHSDSNISHGPEFRKQIKRLMRLGAYDDLL